MPKTGAKEKQLQEQMAKSVSGSAPSMVPTARATPTYTEEEPVPTIEMLIADEEERVTLQKLVIQKIAVDESLKPLEKVKEGITNRIKSLLSGYGITQATCDGARISFTTTERKTINSTKLLENGVDIEVIVASTDITKSATLRITPAKE